MKYLHINDWEIWQSFRKDRGSPPWIKVHRNLMSNHKWSALSDAQKGQLVSIWIAAAENDGKIPYNSKIIQKICQLDSEPNLLFFIELGFLIDNNKTDDYQVGVKLASDGCHNDAPEERRGEDIISEDINISPKIKKNNYTDDFEKFWLAYPDYRRTEKPKAFSEWKLAIKKTEPELIIKAVIGYGKTKQVTDGFAPYPAKWLKNERWNEDINLQTYQPSPPKRKVAENEIIASLARRRELHGEGTLNFLEKKQLSDWEAIHGKAEWERINGINYLKGHENNEHS
jgi:hypothetical protein